MAKSASTVPAFLPEQLRINSAGRTRCEAGWHWRTHHGLFSDADLWLVVQGVGRMRTPAGDFPLAAGDCFVLRGGEVYDGSHDPSRRLVVNHIHFDVLDARGRTLPPARCGLGLHRHLRNLALLDPLSLAVVEAHRQQPNGAHARLLLAACLGQIAVHDATPAPSGPAAAQHAQLLAIADELRHDPAQGWTVAGLAKRVGLGPDQFRRVFLRATGQTPQQLIVSARLSRAMDLLRYGDLPIGEIAALLGYHDGPWFAKQFRAKVGCSPGRFRRRALHGR